MFLYLICWKIFKMTIKKNVLFFYLLFYQAISYGCYCNIINIEKAFNESDVIFVGELVKDEFDYHEYIKVKQSKGDKYWPLYTFNYKQIYKVSETNKTSLITLSGYKNQLCPVSFFKNSIYVVYGMNAAQNIIVSNSCMVSLPSDDNLFLTNHGDITLKKYIKILEKLSNKEKE